MTDHAEIRDQLRASILDNGFVAIGALCILRRLADATGDSDTPGHLADLYAAEVVATEANRPHEEIIEIQQERADAWRRLAEEGT